MEYKLKNDIKSNFNLRYLPGYGKIIELLIQNGVDIHAQGLHEKTALHLAIEHGNSIQEINSIFNLYTFTIS